MDVTRTRRAAERSAPRSRGRDGTSATGGATGMRTCARESDGDPLDDDGDEKRSTLRLITCYDHSAGRAWMQQMVESLWSKGRCG